MEEKVKEIVATFIRVPAENIMAATPIDRSAVQSSILLHRMYAKLADEGMIIADYSAIKVFGDLFRNGSAPASVGSASVAAASVATGSIGPASPVLTSPLFTANGAVPVAPAPGIGIDIEEIASLPRTSDFRKEGFYTMNFTAREIAYCILKPDPYASFAGLFAAKEAIVKAGGTSRSTVFNTLEIEHNPEGKPQYGSYAISISHSGGMAAAVAVAGGAVQGRVTPAPVTPQGEQGYKKRGPGAWVGWLALLLSAAALIFALLR